MRLRFLLVLLPVVVFFLPSPQTKPENKSDNARPIIFLGDTQGHSILEFMRENNTGVPEAIYNHIAAEDPQCVFHMGDIVFSGASGHRWQEYEHDASQVLDKHIPIYPALGNHEYFGRDSRAMANLSAHFPFLAERTWYSRIIQRLAVIILNSNEGDLKRSQRKEQIEWYKRELARFQADKQIDWIIVISHAPPFTNSKIVHRSDYIQDNFLTEFYDSPKCLAFFSGHCHSYEHFIRNHKHFIVTGGGGGPRQKVFPGAGGDDMPEDKYHARPLRDFNYCRLTFVKNKPLLEVIGYNKVTNTFSKLDQIDFKEP